MPLFHWSSQYTVYVPQIDAEHRAIFLMGAELERAAAARTPQVRIREIVRALMGHAEDHFAHEERLMRDARYQGFEWHKKQHDGVRRKLKELSRRIEADDRQAPAELLEYLAHWLRDHTAVTDRMLGATLRNFGRKHEAVS